MYKLLIGLIITGNALAASYRCDGQIRYQGEGADDAKISFLKFSEESLTASIAEVKFRYTSVARRMHMWMKGDVIACRSNETGCYGINLYSQYDHMLFEIHPFDSRPDVLIHDTGRGIREYKGKFSCR